MRLAFQIKRVAIATLLLLATSMLRVGADLVIGTVVDVNMMETELQDFEQGWAQWSETNMQLVDTSNDTEGKVLLLYSSKKRKLDEIKNNGRYKTLRMARMTENLRD